MENIEMILKLNLAKLDITKLKYNQQGYDWAMLGKQGQEDMDNLLIEINQMLEKLRGGVVENFAHELPKEAHTEALNKHSVMESLPPTDEMKVFWACLNCGQDTSEKTWLGNCSRECMTQWLDNHKNNSGGNAP